MSESESDSVFAIIRNSNKPRAVILSYATPPTNARPRPWLHFPPELPPPSTYHSAISFRFSWRCFSPLWVLLNLSLAALASSGPIRRARPAFVVLLILVVVVLIVPIVLIVSIVPILSIVACTPRPCALSSRQDFSKIRELLCQVKWYMVRKDFNLYNFSYFFRYFLRFSVCSLCCLLPFSVWLWWCWSWVGFGLGLVWVWDSVQLGLFDDAGMEGGVPVSGLLLLLCSSRQKCEYASLVYFCAFRQFSFICWSCSSCGSEKQYVKWENKENKNSWPSVCAII